MKQIVSLIFVCLSFVIANAQSSVSGIPPLFITTNKTTSLIFPAAIRHVDRGTKDVLVEKVKEAENLLLVKAALPGFMETNLSVLTADGHLYSFDVSYDSLPLLLVHRLSPPPVGETIAFKDEAMNTTRVEHYARNLLSKRKTIHGVSNTRWDMQAGVNGIYIKENVMFFQLLLKNGSSIDYDIDFIRFYIRDMKRNRRTASQEVELKPLSIQGNTEMVKGNGDTRLVAAFEKFTIPEAKFLVIEVMEKNGGRHLTLRVRNNKILKAKPVND